MLKLKTIAGLALVVVVALATWMQPAIAQIVNQQYYFTILRSKTPGGPVLQRFDDPEKGVTCYREQGYSNLSCVKSQ